MTGWKSDRILWQETLRSGYLYEEGGTLCDLRSSPIPGVPVRDYTGKLLLPGFIDLHTHGGGGHPFMNGTEEDVVKGCNFHLTHGTTAIMPTVSAGPLANMTQALSCISAAKKSGRTGNTILGAHLEGPFLSAKQCGAQCPDFITPPDLSAVRQILAAFPGEVARWTYAPEGDPEGAFAALLSSAGILPTAGHTDAKYPEMATALQKGMRMVTHLYSCTSTVTRDHGFRSLGVIESTFLLDDLYAEIIADGKHLPPELVQMIVKIKGKEKVVAVTDSLELAGTDAKEGIMSGTPFLVEDGVCKLRDRSAFAGSVATADVLLRVLVGECHFDLPTASGFLSKNPAALLGLPKGRLAPGCDADVVVLSDALAVSAVFVGGKQKV